MNYYEQYKDLQRMPTSPVDWVAVINTMVDSLARGRTLKLTAHEALSLGKAFYIGSDGEAHVADGSSAIRGVWLSASTAGDAEGYGQTGGIMENLSWSWTPGGKIYAGSAGALTQTESASANMVAEAVSATLIIIAEQAPATTGTPAGDVLPGGEQQITCGDYVVIDWTDGAQAWMEFDRESVGFSFTGMSAGGRYTLGLKHGSTGSIGSIAAWPAALKWQGGSATLTGAGATDWCTFVAHGVTIYGALAADFT